MAYQDCYSPTLAAYRFCTTAGTSDITGHYVDENGMRTGNLFSGSFDALAVKGLADIADIPEGAVGAVVDLSADVRYETTLEDGTASDLADLQAMGPTIPAGQNITIGRVR